VLAEDGLEEHHFWIILGCVRLGAMHTLVGHREERAAAAGHVPDECATVLGRGYEPAVAEV